MSEEIIKLPAILSEMPLQNCTKSSSRPFYKSGKKTEISRCSSTLSSWLPLKKPTPQTPSLDCNCVWVLVKSSKASEIWKRQARITTPKRYSPESPTRCMHWIPTVRGKVSPIQVNPTHAVANAGRRVQPIILNKNAFPSFSHLPKTKSK